MQAGTVVEVVLDGVVVVELEVAVLGGDDVVVELVLVVDEGVGLLVLVLVLEALVDGQANFLTGSLSVSVTYTFPLPSVATPKG